MKPSERQQAIERYAERIQRFGPVVQALGWRDQAQQQLRFDIMFEGLVLRDTASILDIGCGFGDFYQYLVSQGATPRYVGCDISPEVLNVARNRYPDVQFELRDVIEDPYPDKSFDYVCISGIFNHRLDDNENFLRKMLSTAYRTCSRGVAANMTTDRVDYQDNHLYYFNPESVLSYCLTLTPRVALRQDYPLYEFTTFVYRETRITRSPDRNEGGN